MCLCCYHSRSALISFLMLSAGLLMARNCDASLVIEAPTLSVSANSSGSFYVLLVDTDTIGASSYDVAFDSIELIAPDGSGLSFTNISIATTAPYLFNPSGTTQGGGPFSYSTFPTTDVFASDGLLTSPYYQLVNPGDQFGLARVSYVMSDDVPDHHIAVIFGAGTSLSDEFGNGLSFVTMNSVPEPSSLALGAWGTVFLCWVLRPRRRLGVEFTRAPLSVFLNS